MVFQALAERAVRARGQNFGNVWVALISLLLPPGSALLAFDIKKVRELSGLDRSFDVHQPPHVCKGMSGKSYDIDFGLDLVFEM